MCVFVSKSVNEFILKLQYNVSRYSLLLHEYNSCIGRNRHYKSQQISFVLNVLMMFPSLFSRSTMRTSSSMESWNSLVTPTWWTLPWMYTGIYIPAKKYPTVSGLTSNALLWWRCLMWCMGVDFMRFISIYIFCSSQRKEDWSCGSTETTAIWDRANCEGVWGPRDHEADAVNKVNVEIIRILID